MTDKQKYIERIKALHMLKTNMSITDEEAQDILENLLVLVGSIHKLTNK